MEFSELAAAPDARIDLLTGALLIARDEYPGLDLDVQRGKLDVLAEPLTDAGLARRPAQEQAAALADYLFGECGFIGNEADYYDPRNSFLNDVLDRRLGIPISLAIVYVEVARRVGVPARGVGFPGHFLVRVDGEAGPVVIDPFFRGTPLDEPALEELLRKQGRPAQKFMGALLAPMKPRHVLVRMLMNLRGIYAARADLPRLLVVLDRIVALVPEASAEIRDRGLLTARLGAPGAAATDLRRYLELEPDADDIAEMRRIIQQLETSARQAAN